MSDLSFGFIVEINIYLLVNGVKGCLYGIYMFYILYLIFILILFLIERYFVILKLFYYKVKVNKFFVVKFLWIILVFIVIVIVLSYYLLGNGYNMLEVCVKLKLDEIVIIGYLVVFLMILIIVFGVVMCFCYIRIIKYVWFSDEVKNVKNKVFLRFWWKLIKIFIVVIIVFVVSWLLFFGKFFVKSF